MRSIEQPPFLPMSRSELQRLGWAEIDVLLVSGDAYVDHPSFGAALLGRWLVAHGYRVGVIAQPRWDQLDDIRQLGRPRLFAGVSAGAVDSMLAHYTAFRKKRRDDAYTAGGRAGARPNRATLVYTGLLRRAFAGLPVVVGGIEASLRRVTHYDFWSDRLRRSLLLDSKADVLVYGMAERAVLEIARRLERPDATGSHPSLCGIRGTAFADRTEAIPDGASRLELPSHEAIAADPPRLVEATLALERQVLQGEGGAWALQRSAGRVVVVASPQPPLSTGELDRLYGLPFARCTHPAHEEAVPAEAMIRFSITSHRGCGGGCSFCSLALHQGRAVRSRSACSLAAEVETLTRHPKWKGSVSDVGGPSANMWGASCQRAGGPSGCERSSCLWPRPCRHLADQQQRLVDLLRELKRILGVRQLRVASGVRHDLALRPSRRGDAAAGFDYLDALTSEFVGGQLKIAPEHVVDRVLALMRKPPVALLQRFCDRFERASRAAGKRQYIVPYLMSAFVGCTDRDMRTLARWLELRRWRPRQVQCFIPTPGTVATAMYFAGVDLQGRPVHVPRTDAERSRQHRLLARPPARRRSPRGGHREP